MGTDSTWANPPQHLLALVLMSLLLQPPLTSSSNAGLPASHALPRPRPHPAGANPLGADHAPAASPALGRGVAPNLFTPRLLRTTLHSGSVPVAAPSSTRSAAVPATRPRAAPATSRAPPPLPPRVASSANSTASPAGGNAAVRGASCQLGDGSVGVYRPASECTVMTPAHGPRRPTPGPAPSTPPRPAPHTAPSPTPRPTPKPTTSSAPGPTPKAAPRPPPNPTPRSAPTPPARPATSLAPRPAPNPTPHSAPNPTPRPALNPTPRPVPNPTPRPALNPTPRPAPNPTPRPAPNLTPRPALNPTPRPAPNPTPRFTPNPTPRPAPNPTSRPAPIPPTRSSSNPTPSLSARPEPRPAPSSTSRPPPLTTPNPAPRSPPPSPAVLVPSPPPMPLVCCPADTKADRMCRKYIQNVYQKSQRHQRNPRAIGGKRAKACEFPHMAMIGYGKSINDSQWNCGGTLISSEYVLTAGHCLFSKLGEARWVRLGALNAHNDSKARNFRDYHVAQRIPHPLYRSDSRYNDIGLLRLGRQVAFTAAIKPACLHARRHIQHRQAIATGWGATEPLFHDGSEHLMKVKLDIQKVDACIKAYSGDKKSSELNNGIKDDSMICAGRLEGGHDTCKGDSGGPLQVKLPHTRPCVFSVVGVTSFGKDLCGAPNAPAVYTRVSHFAPWIEGVVWRQHN